MPQVYQKSLDWLVQFSENRSTSYPHVIISASFLVVPTCSRPYTIPAARFHLLNLPADLVQACARVGATVEIARRARLQTWTAATHLCFFEVQVQLYDINCKYSILVNGSAPFGYCTAAAHTTTPMEAIGHAENNERRKLVQGS
jgi:hypothetical protein